MLNPYAFTVTTVLLIIFIFPSMLFCAVFSYAFDKMETAQSCFIQIASLGGFIVSAVVRHVLFSVLFYVNSNINERFNPFLNAWILGSNIGSCKCWTRIYSDCPLRILRYRHFLHTPWSILLRVQAVFELHHWEYLQWALVGELHGRWIYNYAIRHDCSNSSIRCSVSNCGCYSRWRKILRCN